MKYFFCKTASREIKKNYSSTYARENDPNKEEYEQAYKIIGKSQCDLIFAFTLEKNHASLVYYSFLEL